MNSTIIAVVVGIVILVLLIAVAVLLYQRQRSEHLQRRFGPEYDRTIAETGDTRRAEANLESRERRVERLRIRALTADEQGRFAAAWQRTQSLFVDEPQAAIAEADGLIGDVMRARGYPLGDFEERAADVSVDHPAVVSNYRAAHAIALRNQHGQTSTEDLRQAMVHYRSLFDELLGTGPAAEPVIHREEIQSDERTQRTTMGRGRGQQPRR